MTNSPYIESVQHPVGLTVGHFTQRPAKALREYPVSQLTFLPVGDFLSANRIFITSDQKDDDGESHSTFTVDFPPYSLFVYDEKSLATD